ncbi:MAG: hypothetical protein JXA81_14160 [Sedimentisphaerales bacterium]|nr:hypothetical protein [Sedimentisphaerales bacterium]
MIHLILSLDYEIFGNGAGDVMRDIIQPTSRLLSICDKHRAKMTIMFDVGEYWAFEQYDCQLRQDLGYSPCEQMKRQAIDAIRRGHDVQMHLHPQWIGAEYDKGVWQLCNSYWRLADMPGGLGSKSQIISITGALHAGKLTLESMIKPVKADYECVCFRAGGFYAQPSENIVSAMKKVGLQADSSVLKGYKTSTPFEVDYSHVETDKTAWWTTDTELTAEGKPGKNIIELSVSSRMQPYWKNFKKTKLRAALKRRRAEIALYGNRTTNKDISSVPDYRTVMKRLLRKYPSTFDFCKLSSKDMLRRIKEHTKYTEQPIVMIGHSKDFVNDCEFDKFLASLCRNDNVSFHSMSDYVRQAFSILDISSSSETGYAGLGLSGAK